jgi:hypothetical protein
LRKTKEKMNSRCDIRLKENEDKKSKGVGATKKYMEVHF